MNFPFDTDKTPWATVRAEYRNGYAHLRLRMHSLSGLQRYGMDDGVVVVFSNQCGGDTMRAPDCEPFYAWRLGAEGSLSDPLSAKQCAGAAKVLARIDKAMARADEIAGAPAQLIEDYIARLVRAAKVEHVFIDRRANDTRAWPDAEHYTPHTFGCMHDALRARKRELARMCGVVPAEA